jgi:hypothetical protein
MLTGYVNDISLHRDQVGDTSFVEILKDAVGFSGGTKAGCVDDNLRGKGGRRYT